MGSEKTSLITLFLSSLILFGCGDRGSSPVIDKKENGTLSQYGVENEKKPNQVKQTPAPKVDPENSEETEPEATEEDRWWMRFPWEKAARPLLFDEDGTAMPLDIKPRHYYRIRGKTKETTLEIHRQVAKAVGLPVTEDESPKLAMFLSARSSIETSLQGNQRPFDNRGTVHSLDMKAAYRAGIRSRKKYVEAGNELAKEKPWVFLGYGQGGMISWFFLDDWDILGDPRMLGDSVIGALTYRRALVSAYNSQKNSMIRCYEYDDVGRTKTTFYNGKKYRVKKVAINKEKFEACMDEGPKSRAEKRDEEKLVARCERDNRKTYRWKPGAPQPDNTVPIPELTWWQLKRAAGGQPCPPWEGDTYYKHTTAKHQKRAEQFGLDLTDVVRRKDLGDEPEGVNQYELWMQIWDATMVAMEEPPINWERLMTLGSEQSDSVPATGPSKAKIEENRLRARGESIDPYARRN